MIFAIIFQMGFDVILFSYGYSWTPLLYEDFLLLLPLLQRKNINLSILYISICISAIKVIYFLFYLSLSVILSLFWVKVILFFAAIFFLVAAASTRVIFKELALSFLFLFFVSSTFVLFDKEVMHDKLSASFFGHFLGISLDNKDNPVSNNIVYHRLQDDLIKGEGGILVIWEALGVPNKHALIDELQKYHLADVEIINWEGGSTVAAERRYLCGINGQSTPEICLPSLSKYSLALHGNSLSYFNRNMTYKEYGFSETKGRVGLIKDGRKDCYFAYYATCDTDLFEELFTSSASRNCQGFFYGLTIDSHFPYSKYKQHDAELYEDLGKFIQKAKAFKLTHKNCNIYVVGDHPPPLASDFSRGSVIFIKI